MKKLFLTSALTFLVISCDNDRVSNDSNTFQNYLIEGKWCNLSPKEGEKSKVDTIRTLIFKGTSVIYQRKPMDSLSSPFILEDRGSFELKNGIINAILDRNINGETKKIKLFKDAEIVFTPIIGNNSINVKEIGGDGTLHERTYFKESK